MWWGVAAALVANTLYSLGFVLEKRALSTLPALSTRRPLRLLGHVLRSPLWIGGSLALAGGFGAQLAVYRTLPIAAAQGIFVSGLVLLVLLSSRLLGERTSGRERYAIGAILIALLMVVLSLKEGADTVSRHAPPGLVLLICVPTLAGGLWLYANAERNARRRHRMPTNGVEYGMAVGLLYGVSSLAIKGVSSHLTTSGVGGAVVDVLASPYPYLLLFTGAFGLIMSQAALQRSRASLIVPVCTTVTSLFTAVLGTFAFGEPLPEDPVRLTLRVAGTALAVSVLLVLPRHDEEEAPAESGPAPEDGEPEAAVVSDREAGPVQTVAVGDGGSGPPQLPSRAKRSAAERRNGRAVGSAAEAANGSGAEDGGSRVGEWFDDDRSRAVRARTRGLPTKTMPAAARPVTVQPKPGGDQAPEAGPTSGAEPAPAPAGPADRSPAPVPAPAPAPSPGPGPDPEPDAVPESTPPRSPTDAPGAPDPDIEIRLPPQPAPEDREAAPHPPPPPFPGHRKPPPSQRPTRS
ncbi:hypothetical protein DSC45_14075 [Streptomyces sp. YIM 130001]|nr:hypothetical protein DSC45_14075 [Streptomyces sp. YIM 130001]